MNIDNNNLHIVDMLKNSLSNNRLSHAYLFAGVKGTPKLDVALYLACLIYCLEEEKPCLTCKECKSILKQEHLNIHIVKLELSTIKKEQIINLQEEFSKTSLQDGKRIYIIEAIDKTSASAANSLLKFIEEPTNSNNIGILLCDEISHVLPTIISRCFIVNFKEKSKEDFIKSLLDSSVDNELAYIISNITNNKEDAVKYSNDEEFIKIKDVLSGFLKVTDSTNLIIFFQKNKSYFEKTENIKLFINLLAVLLEDLVKSSYEITDLNLLFLSKLYKNYVNIVSKEKLENNLKLVLEANLRINSHVNLKNLLQYILANLLD